MTCTNCLATEGPLCAECEALRWACETHDRRSLDADLLRRLDGRRAELLSVGVQPYHVDAVRTLLDTARAAERLPAMLDVRGVDDFQVYRCETMLYVTFPGMVTYQVSTASIPTLFLALLAIPRQAPDARERTLKALEAT